MKQGIGPVSVRTKQHAIGPVLVSANDEIEPVSVSAGHDIERRQYWVWRRMIPVKPTSVPDTP
eukprot:3567575-Rhodomonas_salina.2